MEPFFRDRLSAAQAEEMLQRLLAWLVRCVEAKAGNLVVRKLCAALAAIFVKTRAQWDACVGHVVLCLQAHGPVAKPNVTADLAPAISGLEQHQYVAAVWFATIVTEEVASMSSDDAKS